MQRESVPIRNGVVALGGYGIRVAVDRRHLLVSDGVGRRRREGRFAKAPARLKRLLVVAQTGLVTLEALRWLHDAGAAFIQLDYDASILTASGRSLDDARYRRAQALIPSTGHGVTIARQLLAPKVRGQLGVLDSFDLGNGDAVKDALPSIESAETLEALLRGEALAAEMYWDAWASVPMQFARRETAPDHWRTFGTRRSPLTLGARAAANPLNALLNYLYALLETETTLALIGRGLDPGLGFFHADTANRQSLAADVMEPVRPHIDAYVLNLARTRTFSTKDFAELRDGSCRLGSSLTQELAATMQTWAKLIAPYAETVARDVAQLAKTGLGIIHPNTAAQRARVRVHKRPVVAPSSPLAAASVPISAVANACKECGAKLTVRKRVYCDRCLPTIRERRLESNAEAFRAAGPAKIAAMRKAGHDPTNTPEARRKRSRTASRKRQEASSWRDDGTTDGLDFKRDILPRLQMVPVKEIANAMDATVSHGSKVRSGKLTPHRRHWKALSRLGDNPGILH